MEFVSIKRVMIVIWMDTMIYGFDLGKRRMKKAVQVTHGTSGRSIKRISHLLYMQNIIFIIFFSKLKNKELKFRQRKEVDTQNEILFFQACISKKSSNFVELWLSLSTSKGTPQFYKKCHKQWNYRKPAHNPIWISQEQMKHSLCLQNSTSVICLAIHSLDHIFLSQIMQKFAVISKVASSFGIMSAYLFMAMLTPWWTRWTMMCPWTQWRMIAPWWTWLRMSSGRGHLGRIASLWWNGLWKVVHPSKWFPIAMIISKRPISFMGTNCPWTDFTIVVMSFPMKLKPLVWNPPFFLASIGG